MKKKITADNKILKTRLKQYSALAASVISLDVSAQVVYTDIKDTTLVNNGDYFDIDLNNDGIMEGKIQFVAYSYAYSSYSFALKGAYVDSLKNAEINVINSSYSTSSSTYVAAALALNQNINNNLNVWSTTSYINIGAKITSNAPSSSYSYSYGQFPGAGDRFLGVKFVLGTSTHYGWLRLDMTANSDSLTIKDFAYNARANAGILAGDTGSTVGISEQKIKNKLDYFASNGKVIIKSKLDPNSILSIYDLSGRLMQSGSIGHQREVSVINELAGIYIVEIKSETNVNRKKLWLETK